MSSNKNDSTKSVNNFDKKAGVADSPDVEARIWYHGYMPRDEINRLLKSKGQFIVRQTEIKQGYVRFVPFSLFLTVNLFLFRASSWCFRCAATTRRSTSR